MHILMLLEKDFPPDLRVENEIKSLMAIGHKVTMACISTSGNHRIEQWLNCKLYKFRIPKWVLKSSVGTLKFPFYFMFWQKHLNDIIATENINAVHVHDLPLARIGAELKLKNNLKFVLDLHENWPAFLKISKHTNTFLGKILSSNKQWENYELISCQQADSVIVVIEEAKERLQYLGIDAKKIVVVANYPVLGDFDTLAEKPKEKLQLVLFYAGGIGEHRGLQYVIKAMPKIAVDYPKVKLKILGEGNYRSVLENMAKELQVKNHIEFTGQVTYNRVLEELATADIALIPHVKSEHTDSTIPHKLFQYMYSGIPIIASNCKPIERILNDSKAGIVYQWDSSVEFAESVIKILSEMTYDPEKIRSVVEEKYSWEAASQNLLAIYVESKN